MSVIFQKRILIALQKAGTNGLRAKELLSGARIKQPEQKRFHAALEELMRSAQVVKHGDRYQLTKKTGLISARITRIQKTFGFAQRVSDNAEVFIPGKFLKGALPEDTVLLSPLVPLHSLPPGLFR
jgi:ribonuclease R